MNSSRTLAFWGAAFALILTYAASASPIPLYEFWRNEGSLNYSDLSLSSVVYFVGAVSALVVFGRLSDFLGRRAIAILALLLTAAASILFLDVHSATPLLIGRLLQGLASGLASTAMASWIVDSVKPDHSHLAPLFISVSPLVGLSLGSLGGGALINYAPWPRTLVFMVILVMVLLSILSLSLGKESVPYKKGLLNSLKPTFGLPPAGRPWYIAAAIGLTCTWAMGAFYQAFGPTIAAEYLHSNSAMAAALVFASFMLPSVLGSTLVSRMPGVKALVLGMMVFMFAVIGIVVSLYFGLMAPFLLFSAVGGTAQGATMNGAIRSLMTGATPADRASSFSVIYATAYTGAALPTLIVGRLTGHFSLLELASGYAMMAALGCALILLVVRIHARSQLSSTTASRDPW